MSTTTTTATSVRFVVNGYELETSEATIRYVPGTYLTWLLDNCQEDVINGRPIQLKTSPRTFCNLIRRLSYLRQHRIPVWSVQEKTIEEQCAKRRRKAMEPGPFLNTVKRKQEETRRHCRPEVCRITTPLPTHASDLDSSIGFAVCAILETFSSLETWPSFFDKVVFLLTCGRTPSGSPLIWPYLCHLFNSRTSSASETFPVHNTETSGMDQDELEALYQSVNISSKLQHQMRVAMREKGYQSVFSDMRIDLNNFFHWRIARISDYGVRHLDNDCTVRCLVVNV
eukprot:g7930.t2